MLFNKYNQWCIPCINGDRGDFMMHGELDKDILSRVIQKILSERDANLEVTVTLIKRDEITQRKRSKSITA